ncbi:MAG: hypothetical protein KZQ59_01250 [Candidatus Thiodiazotropha sp. (ex Lucinoma aequizonata)]|nr:hypothetical protein [Candidatus Thiodiazotropha sp. (ex Lucinoma aequizonata)]MCU7911986.1 hypothetical protein [Candidatus Thiodiazotropha sp. (ex Lucinoma aequizonata)]
MDKAFACFRSMEGVNYFCRVRKLPVNLPQAEYDGHGSINIAFLGQKIGFHEDV